VADASTEEVDITNRAATLAELEAGKVAPTDILSLPMFKNYTPGNATQVLYIKNLAKEVTLEDLHFVYGQLPSSYPHVLESRRGISFSTKFFHILLSLFKLS
jgi:hypothetical protein